MELGGWASFEMVQRYTHLGPEHLAGCAGNAGVANRLHANNVIHVTFGKPLI
jgi:hypothetical protein